MRDYVPEDQTIQRFTQDVGQMWKSISLPELPRPAKVGSVISVFKNVEGLILLSTRGVINRPIVNRQIGSYFADYYRCINNT